MLWWLIIVPKVTHLYRLVPPKRIVIVLGILNFEGDKTVNTVYKNGNKYLQTKFLI